MLQRSTKGLAQVRGKVAVIHLEVGTHSLVATRLLAVLALGDKVGLAVTSISRTCLEALLEGVKEDLGVDGIHSRRRKFLLETISLFKRQSPSRKRQKAQTGR